MNIIFVDLAHRSAGIARSMLCLSQTTGYAIKALGCLNEPAGPCRFIADIARCTGVPRPYLAKIVNSLARQGLVMAKRGYKGGIALARPPAEISLLEIVEAVEGKQWLGHCLLALDDCGRDNVCPTQRLWERIREEVQRALQETMLAEVIRARRLACVEGGGARSPGGVEGPAARRGERRRAAAVAGVRG